MSTANKLLVMYQLFLGQSPTAQHCCNYLRYHVGPHFFLVLLPVPFPAVLALDSKPGAPVHPGQPLNCISWHTVEEGDDCETVPKKYYLTKEEFLAWNPAVSKDCLTNFWLKYAYCVKIDGATAIYTSTKSTTTSKTVLSTTYSDTDTRVSTAKTSSTNVISSTITSGQTVSGTTSESIVTTSLNTTYSIRNPVSTWNITT
ncbi:carbohydrate-binding module family 50, partial [Fusarium sp. NRRL 52700]